MTECRYCLGDEDCPYCSPENCDPVLPEPKQVFRDRPGFELTDEKVAHYESLGWRRVTIFRYGRLHVWRWVKS